MEDDDQSNFDADLTLAILLQMQMKKLFLILYWMSIFTAHIPGRKRNLQRDFASVHKRITMNYF